MDELFSSIDNLSSVSTTERVNPADRSNKDKKKNGFSDILKEKMKEKLKKDHEEDVLILHDEDKEKEEENKQDDQPEESQEEKQDSEEETSGNDSLVEHIDFKA